MGISSCQFRQNNDILKSFKIIHGAGWASPFPDDSQAQYGVVDGIDLLGTGALGIRTKHPEPGVEYREYIQPAFNATVEQMHQTADHEHTQILRANNISTLNSAHYLYTAVKDGKTPGAVEGCVPRQDFDALSLHSLAKRYAPLICTADWAVDTTTDEFLIFAPKQAE